MQSAVFLDLSSSLSVFMDKKDPVDSHFKWASIHKFIYLACSYSSSMYNFDIFSMVCNKIRIFDFIIMDVTFGMSYMFMDFFMKQYTRRLDSPKLLNPLLRGVSYGLFLQTGLWALLHAAFSADCIRFFTTNFQSVPSWSKCRKDSNLSCITAAEIVFQCQSEGIKRSVYFNETSAHQHYVKTFTFSDRNVLTSRFFVMGLVWIFNFFFSTVTDHSIVKIFKLAFICKTFSTFVTVIFLILSSQETAGVAFVEMLDASAEHSFKSTMEHVAYINGIGFLGLSDFGSMSPFTMVDNAVIIFTMLFTVIAFTRSWIMRVLFLELTNCVIMHESLVPHYFLFAVIPLSTEFFHAQKLYAFYIYLNSVVATTAYLAILTLQMSRVLHSEFRSVKNIYIVGILCCFGFGLSLPFAVTAPLTSKIFGLINGVNITILYLGSLKVALIMWVYGVQRFSTDIHFWLGFKPTKFWTISWMLLPIVLMCDFFSRIYDLSQSKDMILIIVTAIWVVFTILVVIIFQIKTIAKFVLLNNIAGVFNASNKYGPPDIDERKARRSFNETIQLRRCKHNCISFDEMIDCNHMPLMHRNSSDHCLATSLTNIILDSKQQNTVRLSTELETESHQ